MGKINQKETKKRFIEELEKSLGIISPAAKRAGVSRETIRLWRQKDPKFDKAVSAITDVAVDFAESMLMKNIQAGDTAAIKFYLGAKARDRGYGENVNVNGDLTIRRPRVIYEDEVDNAAED